MQELESDSSYFKPKSTKHSYKEPRDTTGFKDTAYKGLIPDPAEYSESVQSKDFNCSTSKDSLDSHPYEPVTFGKVGYIFIFLLSGQDIPFTLLLMPRVQHDKNMAKYLKKKKKYMDHG